MKLTSKAKVDLGEWYEKQDYNVSVWFNLLPLSMQWGVYVDWADSVGIHISLNSFDKEYWYDFEPNKIEGINYKTRQEARETAIKKLNEIYNK